MGVCEFVGVALAAKDSRLFRAIGSRFTSWSLGDSCDQDKVSA